MSYGVEWWGPAVGSLAGGLFQGLTGSNNAADQRDWQRVMSDTAHYREMKDLERAGLNPILAAGGGGASSPSGAMAPAIDPVTPAVNTAIAARRASAEIANIEEQNKLIKQQTDESHARTVKTDFDSALTSQYVNKVAEETQNIKLERSNIPLRGRELGSHTDVLNWNAKLLAEDLPGRKIEGDIDRSDFGVVQRILERVFGTANSAGQARQRFNQGGSRRR